MYTTRFYCHCVHCVHCVHKIHKNRSYSKYHTSGHINYLLWGHNSLNLLRSISASSLDILNSQDTVLYKISRRSYFPYDLRDSVPAAKISCCIEL